MTRKERQRSTEEVYGELFGAVSQVPGLRVFPRLDPPLPTPGQFDVELVLQSDAPVEELLETANAVVGAGWMSGKFLYVDTDLKICARTLGGRTVPYESLSGGAKEQLGILTRLAGAALVAKEDSVPVVIDDALGFTDPDRLEKMGAVFDAVGSHGQVIVLTCSPDRYRSVTTVSRNATAADALTKAFILMPQEGIRSVLPHVDIERVHLIDATGIAHDLIA